MRAGLEASPFSRALLAAAAAVSRQALFYDRAPGFEGYPVAQFVYRDRRGRTHWDRYAQIDGAWQRLFTARVATRPRHLIETFVVYGLPIPLTFRARVEDDALVLTLTRRWTSPLSWLARVEYRTEAQAGDVRTRGDFRIPALFFRAETEFRGAPADQ